MGEDAAVTHWLDHSLVLASDCRVPHPDRVESLLTRRSDALAALGAHHVLLYASTNDPGRMLMMIAIHGREPVLELLRSHAVIEWFDAVGVEDIPAVFAGELIERIELIPAPHPSAPEVLVSVVTHIESLATLRAHVRDTAGDLRAAGIRMLSAFRAFDDSLELMVLLQIDDEVHAQRWLGSSDLAAAWLEQAGIGAYPPIFTGRLRGVLRMGETPR
jgi:hypothetical protein